jgi:hypothetical protein
MSRFTSILLVSPLADGRTWVLMREFGSDVGAEGSQDQIGECYWVQLESREAYSSVIGPARAGVSWSSSSERLR